MTAQGTSTPTNQKVLHQSILGSRRLSNYAWATIISIGATGFLLAGISSYSQVNLIPFSNPTDLVFVPQGLVMGLYGSAGLLLALYLWLVILWDVGGGYNEFNAETGKAQIFRWGFPGKNRTIDLTYPLEDIQAVGVVIKEGLNPQRKIYLRVKGKGNIPLTRVGQPISLSDIENQAAELARFLEVSLEGL